MQSNSSFKMRYLVSISVILLMILLFGCVSKKNIKVPLADPLFHPKLAQMQSLSIEEKDGITYFGESRKYMKRGITVVSLKGDPYEMGYAHGVLLKDEMIPWIRKAIHWAKSMSFGTSLLENKLMDRAKAVEQYIPEKNIRELKGLAAGSGIDYGFILGLNTALTTARAYFCTSVAVKMQDGKLIRSRSNEASETYQGQILRPVILFIYQPTQGYSFSSVMVPGLIGVWTAMNETGLNFGDHQINYGPNYWKGIPTSLLNREILENANSVEEAGEILKKAPRSIPWMHMVTDTNKARIYEYDSEEIGYKDMDENRLIVTNYTQVLNIGYRYFCNRYLSASGFLDKNQNEISVKRLVELNRSDSISRADSHNRYSHSLAIFIPETMDFWIAVDPPTASRGRWVGFNLKKENDGSGHEPNPLIIPAMSLKYSSK